LLAQIKDESLTSEEHSDLVEQLLLDLATVLFDDLKVIGSSRLQLQLLQLLVAVLDLYRDKHLVIQSQCKCYISGQFNSVCLSARATCVAKVRWMSTITQGLDLDCRAV